MISLDNEYRFRFETSMTKMTPTVDYPTINLENTHHRNLKTEGMIFNHLVSVLIDPGSNLSYISPKAIDKCKLQPHKHAKSLLV